MRHYHVIALAALAALPAAPGRSGDFAWHGRVAAGGVLEIKGVNGAIEAGRATGAEAEVTAVKRAQRSNPDEVEIKVVEHPGGVTLCAVYPSRAGSAPNECRPGREGRMSTSNNDVNVAFNVKVPAGVRFVARTVNGSVATRDLPADAEAYTVNGRIDLQSAGAARGETVNGAIHASLGRADWQGDLSLKTVNGSITLEAPAGLETELLAETVNGTVRTEFQVAAEGRVSKRRVAGTIGRGGRKLALATVNGGIELKQKD
jgi:DUF4097 and DUF4098 domain-containing protein YvlB